MRFPEFTAEAALASTDKGASDSSSAHRPEYRPEPDGEVTAQFRCTNFRSCCIAAGGDVICSGSRCYCI
jgi:hypothetical protein